MSEKLTESEWTSLIQKPGADWNVRRAKSPVLKVTYPHGMVVLGVLGALVNTPEGAAVTGLDWEISESGTHSCLTGDILVSELAESKIQIRDGRILKVEFDGLASDLKHQGRQWSYWF